MARANHCLGIDIGSQTIRIAEAQISGGKVQIRNLIEARIEADPAAQADRYGAIAAQINQLIKTHGLKARKAVFCVPGQMAVVRTVKPPPTTPDKLERVMQILAREQIPFPLDKVNLEYQVFEGRDETELEGLLVALRKDHVEGFMKLVRRTGLSPLAISVSSLALHNFHEVNRAPKDFADRVRRKKAKAAKKKKGEADDAPEQDDLGGLDLEQIPCEVNLGATVMDLVIPKIAKAQIVGFPRSVPRGGNLVDQAIRQRLNLATVEQAQQLKETKTAVLSSEFELSADATQFDMNACQAATAAVDQLAGEIRRSIEFFIAQPDGVAADTLVLSGGLTNLPYLESYLEEKLGMPVERASIKNEDVVVDDENAPKVAAFVIPIGLAFQGLGLAQVNVDFLPQDIKNVRAFAENRIQLAAAVGLLGLVVWSGLGAGNKYIQQNNAYAEDVEQKRLNSKSQTDRLTDANSRNMEVYGKYYNLQIIKGEPEFWLEFSLTFLEARPGDILIEQLEMFNNGMVRVKGRTPRKGSITDFKDNLERLKGEVITSVAFDELPDPVADAALGTRVQPFTMRIITKSRLGRYRDMKQAPSAKGQQGSSNVIMRRRTPGPGAASNSEGGPPPGRP